MQHLVVILDESAPSFCFYPNPQKLPKMMSLDVLKKVVFFAQKRNLILNFLLGKTELHQSYIDVIDEISHLFMLDSHLSIRTLDDIVIIDLDKVDNLPTIQNIDNIILRVNKTNIDKLSDAIISFVNSVRRINVHLLDIDLFTQTDFDRYQQQLNKLSEIYSKTYNKELNILTDRTVLYEMNNCDAGIKHITVAPNGKLYICPAFYYDNPENTIGSVDDEICIANKQLYRLEYAPICRQCDAFHCRRCAWLNQKTTGEVNTPSHEQCVISHLERNASRALLIQNQENDYQIPEINYLDPIEK
ncbi:hypothetical protein MASR2M117_02540 [Paludibacter sp.]